MWKMRTLSTIIYRILHPTTEKYTFYAIADGTFTKLDHTYAGPYISKDEIIQNMFFDQME